MRRPCLNMLSDILGKENMMVIYKELWDKTSDVLGELKTPYADSSSLKQKYLGEKRRKGERRLYTLDLHGRNEATIFRGKTDLEEDIDDVIHNVILAKKHQQISVEFRIRFAWDDEVQRSDIVLDVVAEIFRYGVSKLERSIKDKLAENINNLKTQGLSIMIKTVQLTTGSSFGGLDRFPLVVKIRTRIKYDLY